MRVVLQGFGPFGRFQVNPSERLVRDLAESPPSGVDVVPLVLRTADAEVAKVPGFMAEWGPDVWIGVGLAGGRHAVAVERVAINVADYGIGDVDGVEHRDEPIIADGPVGYWSTLPVARIVAAWRAADVPGYVSNSAGTYLCNRSFYVARHAAQQLGVPRTGFIHVPAMVEQVQGGGPAWPYALLRQALALAVAVAADPA
ncbi:MAG: pyroglutamyl-peptidase I [Thermaerobacter sp.]|nr:pyroglutamyl-peptidase I [Thermaerobacter sp.]